MLAAGFLRGGGRSPALSPSWRLPVLRVLCGISAGFHAFLKLRGTSVHVLFKPWLIHSSFSSRARNHNNSLRGV